MISGAPEGWGTIKLGEVLTKDQIKVVLGIVKEPDYPKRIAALKEFCHSIEGQLDEKGLLPEFLAYWLEFKHLKDEI